MKELRLIKAADKYAALLDEWHANAAQTIKDDAMLDVAYSIHETNVRIDIYNNNRNEYFELCRILGLTTIKD